MSRLIRLKRWSPVPVRSDMFCSHCEQPTNAYFYVSGTEDMDGRLCRDCAKAALDVEAAREKLELMEV